MFETFLTEVLKLAPRQMWGLEQMGEYLKKYLLPFLFRK